jgi:hypothetical protein
MRRFGLLGLLVVAGCGQDVGGVTAPALHGLEDGQAVMATHHHSPMNQPPVVEIRGVSAFRDGVMVQLHRPFKIRVHEHAVISIVWLDPDGDVTAEVSHMSGTPGIYNMGIPLDGVSGGLIWQADDMVPSSAGHAHVRAVVTDSKGASAEAAVAIHVVGSGH